MNYKIELTVWNLGYDEAEELAEAVGELARSRGLAAQGPTSELRSVVNLRHVGDRLNVSDLNTPEKVVRSLTRNARMTIVPIADPSEGPIIKHWSSE